MNQTLFKLSKSSAIEAFSKKEKTIQNTCRFNGINHQPFYIKNQYNVVNSSPSSWLVVRCWQVGDLARTIKVSLGE